MYKKLLLTLAVSVIFTSASHALTFVKVEAMEEFSSANPPEEMCLKVAKSTKLGSYDMQAGDVITCDVVKVVKPKRGKRNAKFYIKVTELTSGEETRPVTENLKGKYTKFALSKEVVDELPKGELAEKALMKVSEKFAKSCLGPTVSIAQGMIKNEEGNILKSGAAQLYKDSPFSFLSKGKNVELQQGDTFYLSFKVKKPKTDKKLEETATEQQDVEQD